MSAKAIACKGVTTINQALISLANISVSTTVGDVKAAQTKVANAVNAIQARVSTNDEGLLSQVSAANGKLAETIKDYPDQSPIGQTSTSVQDIKARVADAQSKTERLASALTCPS
jgi:hypothetical protein